MSKNVKNAYLAFQKSNVTSSQCFFGANNSPKHKDSSFTVVNDTEKQQVVTFKKLNLQFFYLNLKKQLKRLKVGNYFSID